MTNTSQKDAKHLTVCSDFAGKFSVRSLRYKLQRFRQGSRLRERLSEEKEGKPCTASHETPNNEGQQKSHSKTGGTDDSFDEIVFCPPTLRDRREPPPKFQCIRVSKTNSSASLQISSSAEEPMTVYDSKQNVIRPICDRPRVGGRGISLRCIYDGNEKILTPDGLEQALGRALTAEEHAGIFGRSGHSSYLTQDLDAGESSGSSKNASRTRPRPQPPSLKLEDTESTKVCGCGALPSINRADSRKRQVHSAALTRKVERDEGISGGRANRPLKRGNRPNEEDVSERAPHGTQSGTWIRDERFSDASQSKPDPRSTRTWTDRSGFFQVEAELLGVAADMIYLHKLNGVRISVSLTTLSAADLAYVVQDMNNNGYKMPFQDRVHMQNPGKVSYDQVMVDIGKEAGPKVAGSVQVAERNEIAVSLAREDLAIPPQNIVVIPRRAPSTYSASIYQEYLDCETHSGSSPPASLGDTMLDEDSDPEEWPALDLERVHRVASAMRVARYFEEEPAQPRDMVDVAVVADQLTEENQCHLGTHLESIGRLQAMIDKAKDFPPSLQHAAAWKQGLRQIEQDLRRCHTDEDVAAVATDLSQLAETTCVSGRTGLPDLQTDAERHKAFPEPIPVKGLYDLPLSSRDTWRMVLETMRQAEDG